MRIGFAGLSYPRAAAIVVFATSGGTLLPSAVKVDKKSKGAISRAAKSAGFAGKKAEIASILGPFGLAASRLVLVGLGDPKKLTTLILQEIGGAVAGHLKSTGQKEGHVAVDAVDGTEFGAAEVGANIAFGAKLRSYEFNRYRTRRKKDTKRSPAKFVIMSGEAKAIRAAYADLSKVADGVFLTRDLVSEPGNVIYPETLAAEAKELASLGLKVTVLGEAAMAKRGMGALLGVGQGSQRESKLIVLEWNGAANPKQKPVAFVGKGVTFDSGGISLKPGAGMGEMKYDMGGSGVVLGLMKALAGRKARVNAVGVIGAVENMPSGTAQRPGDVVKSLSGQTIEVLNTDAEGRLVLADALWYCQSEFKPKIMIDLATLTGAIVIALGNERAGIFSNNDDLAAKLEAAAEATGEAVWRLPLGVEYDKHIDSVIADMQNVGRSREAGSISAAQFLQRFVNKVPWVHIDIAGKTWDKSDTRFYPKGATGYGVRLLERLVADNYEEG